MRIPKSKWLLLQIPALVVLAAAILLTSHNNARADASMTGDGAPGVPYEITNCQQLQNMDDDLFAMYALANDIDCSDTINWNGGDGFLPIGGNGSSQFQGSFDGRGHTISHLYINNATTEGQTGLFGKTKWSRIGNVKLTDATIIGHPTASGISGVGSLIGRADDTFIDLISFDGTLTVNDCSINPSVGGLVGSSIADEDQFGISRSSSSGSITVTGSNCGNYQAAVGGLVGMNTTGVGKLTAIRDSYSRVSINILGDADNTTDCDSNANCRAAGGLAGLISGDGEAIIAQSYSAGSIHINDTTEHLSYKVGGLIGQQYIPVDVYDTFSATAIDLPITCASITCDTTIRNYGALVSNSSAYASLYHSFYYDATIAPNDSCYENTVASECNAKNVGGVEPDYFYNETNFPLSGFNFTLTWQESVGDYPVIRNGINNYSPAPTAVATTIIDSHTINVSWNESDTSNLWGFTIICKKIADTAWQNCGETYEKTDTNKNITSLLAGTPYMFKVVPINVWGYFGAISDTAYGTTATPGYELISSCQDLQNIANDYNKNYELAHNIDCSDTVNWDNGAGFDPIGSLDFMDFGATTGFRGIFKGNNYTISNLYSDRTGGTHACGLFEFAGYGAVIQDLKIDNLSCSSNIMSGALTGGFVGGGGIQNVQITNSTLAGPNTIGVGGVAGMLQTDFGANSSAMIITNTSFQGLVGGYNPIYAGGFAAIMVGKIQATNNYSNADIILDATTFAGGFAGGFAASDQGIMSSNYSSGTLSVTNSDPNVNQADTVYTGVPDIISGTAGFIGYEYDIETPNAPIIANNFAHMQISSASPEDIRGGFFTIPAISRDLDNDYFDADMAGTTDCSNQLAAQNGAGNIGTGCTAISGQPSYFKNNSTNPPLDQWDFTNIWKTTTELPVFGQSVTTGISQISQPGTTGQTCITLIFSSTKICTDGSPTSDNPTVSGVSGQVSTAGTGTGVGSKASTTPADEVGVIGALKHFVRSLPVAVIVAFPYALFGLLFMAILFLALEFVREIRRAHILEALIRKQQLLAEERDAFWHLAANYLRAPITLIVGGAESLADMHKTAEVATITTLSVSLQQKVAEIMKKIEGSASLQSINKIPHGFKRGKVRRITYILPLSILAALLVFANYAASSWRNVNPGAVGYLAQILIFITISIALYWALSYLSSGKGRRKQAEEMYARQTNELNSARHELINDTATLLANDTKQLDAAIKTLPITIAQTAPGALATLREGSDRLREIVHSFALLIKVQEGAAIATSPVDLGSMFGAIRAKLTPQITAKNVRVAAPAASLPVSAESEMARQVIESIVTNAVDYSPAGGTVNIETRNLGDKVQVRISDQGQGIAKDQLAHLFQPFVRTDGKSAMDMSHGGFGINLYLDKLIMEKLGGTIEAASTPGKGTAFTLTWPTARG